MSNQGAVKIEIELTGAREAAAGVDGVNAALGRGTTAAAGFDRPLGTVAADLAAIRQAGAQAAAGTQAFTAPLPAAGATAGATAARVRELGEAHTISAKQTAAAMRGLPAQLTDVATQLAGGQNPLLIMLQQGGQVKDQFGGLRPMFSALASAVSPAGLAITAVGGAVVAMGLAAYQGASQQDTLRRALILSGGAAGLTEGQIAVLNRTTAQARDVTVGSVQEITAALVDAGTVGGAGIDSATKAVLALQRVSGQATDAIIGQFAGMSSAPTAWAAKANQAYRFLTAAQYDEIRALEAQGRGDEAVRKTLDALTATMDSRAMPALGTLERAWRTTTAAISGFWEGLKAIGRDKTADERIASLTARIEAAQAALDKARSKRGTSAAVPSAADPLIERAQRKQADDLARMLSERDALAGANNLTLLNSAANGAALKADLDKIKDMQAAHQAAVATLDRANAARTLADLETSLEIRREASNKAFEQDEITAKEHQDRLYQIDLAGLAGREVQVKRLAEIESNLEPTNPEEALAKKAALVAYGTQLEELRKQRMALSAEERSGSRDVAPKSRSIGPGDGLAQMRAADSAAAQADIDSRKAAAMQAASELLDANRQLSQALITDDHQRGIAQINEEQRVLDSRLKLEGQSANDRQQIEERLADWRVMREQQLTEQLKPYWRQQLDAWADNNRLMRESYDETMGMIVRDGEDAFVKLITTGKTDFKALTADLVSQWARLQFRQGGGGQAMADLGASAMEALGWKTLKGYGSAKEGDANFMGPLLPGAGASGGAAAQGAALNSAATQLGGAGSTLATAGASLTTAAADLVAAAAMMRGGGGGGGLGLIGLGGGSSSSGGAGGIDYTTPTPQAGFAVGGAFGQGEVLTRPTSFRYVQGGQVRSGIAGEAGPEAAIPLPGGGVSAAVGGQAIGSLPLTRINGVLGVDVTALAANMQRQTAAPRAFASGGAFGSMSTSLPSSASLAGGASSGRAPTMVKLDVHFAGNGVSRNEMAAFAQQLRQSAIDGVAEAARRGRRV
jgi:phage-related minor tail protein